MFFTVYVSSAVQIPSQEELSALLETIKADRRHRGIIVLMQHEHVEREFSEWSMGFKALGKNDRPAIPGYDDFLDLPLTSERFLLNPSRCLKLLLSFRKSIR